MSDNLTPQQSDFQRYYFDPKSPTFSNALQSALKAGYSQETSENITNIMPKWLSEMLGKKKRLVMKAEKRLEEAIDDKDIKVGLDASKFTLSRLKKEEYSDRTEITGEDGNPVIFQTISTLADKNNINDNSTSEPRDNS